ncbi:MAG: hypothetical protein KAW67_03970, partial [Candidatus Eisenbacteria sp.]|nr:hypothetical protein [Candidatus Eisenbacteria bacterium]
RRAGLEGVGGPAAFLSRMGLAATTGSSGLGTCPDAGTIAGYVDGSLEGDRAGEVERHVVSCRTCLGLAADLWAMSGAEGHDAPDRVVARVLARLESDSRTAVLRWAERSIELVRDFASSWAEGAGGAPAFVADPAVATSRSSGSGVRLHWSGEGGAVVEAVVRGYGRAASLTCRVTVDGSPAAAVSAVLSSDSVTTGPESLDADGRFGPWPLVPGDNVLRLTGLSAEAGDVAELVVVLAATVDEPE